MATFNKEYFHEVIPNQLDIFNLPGTQTAIQRTYYQDVLPISQLTGKGTIEFYISGNNGMEYLDLKNTQIHIKVRIKKLDGSNLPSNEYVGPVNSLLSSLFNQVDVSINGRIITPSTSYYQYKAYIQNLLKYGNDTKTSQLTTQLWKKDTSGHLDDNDVHSGQNTALFERSSYFTKSKTVDLVGPIHHDLFQMERFILNQVGLAVKFYRSKPEFCLITNELNPDYDIVIEEMFLRVHKVSVNPAVIMGHNQMLSRTNAKYFFTKTDLKVLTIASGQVSFTFDNIFQGWKPNKIIVGFTSSQASAGSYTTNPFNFKNLNLSAINISVDGVSINGSPLKMSFDSNSGNLTTSALTSLFETTGKWTNDYGMQLNRDDIAGGYALYAFNLEPDFNQSGYLTLMKQGICRLDVNFDSSLAEPTNCIIYAEFPGYFEVNQSRDIITE